MLPSAKLGELVRLAELCVDLLQENNEYYAEVNVFPSLPVTMSVHPAVCVSVSEVNHLSFLSLYEPLFPICPVDPQTSQVSSLSDVAFLSHLPFLVELSDILCLLHACVS